jgi:hypothetical protein
MRPSGCCAPWSRRPSERIATPRCLSAPRRSWRSLRDLGPDRLALQGKAVHCRQPSPAMAVCARGGPSCPDTAGSRGRRWPPGRVTPTCRMTWPSSSWRPPSAWRQGSGIWWRTGPPSRAWGAARPCPGAKLITDHRAELNEAEEIVNAHVAAWRDGDPTPVGPAVDAMLARRRALPVGEELLLEWPTRRLPRASVRVRRAATQRRPRRAARS